MKNTFYKIYQKSSKRYRKSSSGKNMWGQYPTQVLKASSIDVFDDDYEIHVFELIHISTQPLRN